MVKSLINSFKFAVLGLKYAVSNERNFRIHLVALLYVMIFAYIAKVSKYELLTLIFISVFVIFAELMNTAIELACNNFGRGYSIYIKHAKDVSASAVLCVAMSAIIIGFIIFIPKISLINSNMNIYFIITILALLPCSLLFIFKGEKNEKKRSN